MRRMIAGILMVAMIIAFAPAGRAAEGKGLRYDPAHSRFVESHRLEGPS